MENVRHECIAPLHDHTTVEDGQGGTLDQPVLMTCQHCGKPAHYDSSIEAYQHDDADADDCFLIAADDRAVPCQIEEPDGDDDNEWIAEVYTDLDPDELVEVAHADFEGNLSDAADHLRRLRGWYT